MAMSGASGSTGLNSDPNLTPMIDVLLVLLVIFMLIIPMSRKALDVQLPDPTPPTTPQPPNPDQIVLEVLPNGVFAVNKEPHTKDDIGKRLKEIFDPRPEKIIFVKGDPDVIYQDVIFAMDAARGAGVKVIGVPPKAAPAAAKPVYESYQADE
jgi:biopolymer transport protein TolR